MANEVRSAELAITSLISNKREWNNCFIKFSFNSDRLDSWTLQPNFIELQSLAAIDAVSILGHNTVYEQITKSESWKRNIRHVIMIMPKFQSRQNGEIGSFSYPFSTNDGGGRVNHAFLEAKWLRLASSSLFL